MSRIDEIKERIRRYNNSVGDERLIAWEGLQAYCDDDIVFLLSKLEIAEKALEKISIPMPGSRDNELVLYYERISKEALQQIRS